MVVEVALYHGPQPLPDFGHWLMPASPKHLPDCFEFCGESLTDSLAIDPPCCWAFIACAIVGSGEARSRAGLRPPLKLHVRFSRMQLSRRLSYAERQVKE